MMHVRFVHWVRGASIRSGGTLRARFSYEIENIVTAFEYLYSPAQFRRTQFGRLDYDNGPTKVAIKAGRARACE